MWGEDLIIKRYFESLEKGFYVDVGAYHPFYWSNTYLLYKKKWEGINIDLTPLSIDVFNYARSGDYNFNLAITNKKKKFINYYSRREMNTLATTSKEFAKTSFLKGCNVSKVKCSTLNNVISKTKFKNRQIDFLNIDTENTELEVLKSLNFRNYRPKLICIEIHHRNKKELKSNHVYNFLLKKKYKKIWNKEYSFLFSDKTIT